VYTKYASGYVFREFLQVSKFSVEKVGSEARPNTIHVRFEETGSVEEAEIYLEPELAIPLARNLLSVAEGYIFESRSEVA
jgi:hypothetical protein